MDNPNIQFDKIEKSSLLDSYDNCYLLSSYSVPQPLYREVGAIRVPWERMSVSVLYTHTSHNFLQVQFLYSYQCLIPDSSCNRSQ